MTFGSWRSPGGSRRTGDTVRRQPRRWSRNGVAGAPLRRGVGRYTSAFQRVRAARGTLEGTESPWRTGRPGTSNGAEDVTDSSTEESLEVDRPWRSPEAAATSTSERVRARQSGTSRFRAQPLRRRCERERKRQGGNGRGDAVRRVQGPRPERVSEREAGSSRGVKATLRESRDAPSPCISPGNRCGGRRAGAVETSEVMPVPGAIAWEPARGGNRRGGDRTTRAEREGSGGTDSPKGATPGVDARR